MFPLLIMGDDLMASPVLKLHNNLGALSALASVIPLRLELPRKDSQLCLF